MICHSRRVAAIKISAPTCVFHLCMDETNVMIQKYILRFDVWFKEFEFEGVCSCCNVFNVFSFTVYGLNLLYHHL